MADAITLDLTPFQAAEVENGLDIDAADQNPGWGELNYTGRPRAGKDRPARLVIPRTQAELDAALYRLTSIRDIWGDNAGDIFSAHGERSACRSRFRSMSGVVDRFIEAAGGREAFSPGVQRWIAY